MTSPVRTFLLRWGVCSVGVLLATRIVPGIECPSWPGLFAAALLLGLLNAFVRPWLLLLSLPLVLVTLGLFLWVINAALLLLVGALVKPFHVAGFLSALGGAAVISLVSTLLGGWLGLNRTRLQAHGPRPPSFPHAGSRSGTGTGTGSGPGPGRGPIIDV